MTTTAMRSRVCLLALVSMALALTTGSASAKGGSSVAVVTTALVTGSVVSGTVTITNTATTAATVTAVRESLEVRYPTGYPPPALPAGATSGYYVVALVALSPPGPIPPLGTVSIAYSMETCSAQVARYVGAKDMRAVAVATVGAEELQARTTNFVPPSQLSCPVCGNGIREGSEQCDGGGCCTSACRAVLDGSACSDANACTQGDRCRAGQCAGGSPVTCQAVDQCHDAGLCNPTTGACSTRSKPNGTACDDGNACSVGDVCSNGWCVGSPMACDDQNVCTTDACANGACVHTANDAPCDDGNACTVDDRCGGGACWAGAPLDCNDRKVCTEDACDPAAECTYVATPTCDGCAPDECAICRAQCTADHATCTDDCWAGFWTCLAGCTSTYCAPFCQVDLGACVAACPDETVCGNGCDAGNACAAGCTPPQ